MISSVPEGSELLNDSQRQRLANLADLLLPAAHGMPSASDAAVHTGGVDRTLTSRPDLAEPLRALLADDGPPDEFVAREMAAASAAWDVLTLVVAGSYYMNAEVRRRISYPGQVGRVLTDDEFFRIVSDGLLDPVLARGPIYRSV